MFNVDVERKAKQEEESILKTFFCFPNELCITAYLVSHINQQITHAVHAETKSGELCGQSTAYIM